MFKDVNDPSIVFQIAHQCLLNVSVEMSPGYFLAEFSSLTLNSTILCILLTGFKVQMSDQLEVKEHCPEREESSFFHKQVSDPGQMT